MADMVDYENRHAIVWEREEELEKKRQNRVNKSAANRTIPAEPSAGPNRLVQTSAGGRRFDPRFQQNRPFDIRNRSHSAYPEHVVVTESQSSAPQPHTFTVPRREYANRHRGRGDRSRGGGQSRFEGPSFQRTHAYDPRREAREEDQIEEVQSSQTLQERPSNLDEYAFQLFYLWPSEDIPMDEFNSHFDKRVIEEIRYGAQSWVEFDSAESLVRVWSMNEMCIRSVALRINNLVKELVAKINNSMRICFVQHPIRGFQNAIVTLYPTPDARPAFPILKYSPEPSDDYEDPGAGISKTENARMMALIVGQCFKNLRLPKQYVNLKLRIGLVTLGRRMNFMPGRDYYGFEEFVSMLEQSLTETKLDSLVPTGLTNDQVERIRQLDILQNPFMLHGVEFHFLDATTDSMLVMQHEWKLAKEGEELDDLGRRWVSIPQVPDEKPLEITVVDFDRADIQLRIDTFNAYARHNIVRNKLERFEESVKFRPDSEALTTVNPNPTTSFQWGVGNLQSVKEKSSMVFDIKSTRYKFAITRVNTYKVDALKSTRDYQGSDFDFSIFDPEWDSNLAEFSWLSPGQEVSWRRSIVSFFARPSDAMTDDINEGFFRFLRMVDTVVEQVQGVLGPSDDEATVDGQSGEGAGIESP